MIIFLSCTLAVPTVAQLMGLFSGPYTREALAPWLAVGALLGVTHIVIRPILRVLAAPIGCLTLGLFGVVIDVALIYGCGSLVRGFAVPSPLYALMTAVTVNAICAIAAGRR